MNKKFNVIVYTDNEQVFERVIETKNMYVLMEDITNESWFIFPSDKPDKRVAMINKDHVVDIDISEVAENE